MSGLGRALALAVVAVLTAAGATTASAATDAEHAGPVDRAGRTAVVVEPTVYADLVDAGVEITPIGRTTVKPYENTVRITLPVREVTGSAVKHRGGIRFVSADADLDVRNITIPTSGFVSGAVSGSEVGSLGRVLLFLQADSSSPFGDTSLRFTWTFASYLNESFGTDFGELGFFGFATTRLR